METHAIAVIVLADYTPTTLLDHSACKPGLFSPLTASGAPMDPVEALITVEAPQRLLTSIASDHQHVSLWDDPISVTGQVQCIGFERFEIDAGTHLLCRHFLTLHLRSDSAKAMETVLSDLARIKTAPARAILKALPFDVHPSPLVQRAFAFLHTEDPSYETPGDSLLHVVPKEADVAPGHWTHGRLSFAAQTLAIQLSNQVLLDLLPTPDGRTPTDSPGGANEYVQAVRNFLANAWWPDFSLDPATQLVTERFYARTRLRARVAEERETMRDIWAASEAANSLLLNRVGLVLGTSTVVAAWFALAADRLGPTARLVTAGTAGLLTLALAAYAPRRGHLK